MRKRYRLRSTRRFRELRERGRTWANRYLVLSALPNGLPHSRFGVIVTRRFGKAVARNKLRRRLREALRLRLDRIPPGWDVVVIARNPAKGADFWTLSEALEELLRRAGLWNEAQASPLGEAGKGNG